MNPAGLIGAISPVIRGPQAPLLRRTAHPTARHGNAEVPVPATGGDSVIAAVLGNAPVNEVASVAVRDRTAAPIPAPVARIGRTVGTVLVVRIAPDRTVREARTGPVARDAPEVRVAPEAREARRGATETTTVPADTDDRTIAEPAPGNGVRIPNSVAPPAGPRPMNDPKNRIYPMR